MLATKTGQVPVLGAVRHPPRYHETPTESDDRQDRHKAPTHPLIHPLSLQDVGT